jgi:hypothetical protein
VADPHRPENPDLHDVASHLPTFRLVPELERLAVPTFENRVS